MDIDAIENRANAATPGPWDAHEHPDGFGWWVQPFGEDSFWVEPFDNPMPNAVFIAAARQDVPALCAEVRRLRAELADVRARADDSEAEIGRLVAELAVVRRDWQADVGTLTARAQTAEARAARLNTEVGYLLEENEEMGRREMQRAAAARKVAQFARKNMAAMQHVQRAQRERDGARAEAARLRELLNEAVAGVSYAVTFGNMIVNGETMEICGDPEAVLYLLGESQSIEQQLRAALRGPAQSEQPASCECGHRMTNHATADDGRRVCMILGCTCILPAARRQETNDDN